MNRFILILLFVLFTREASCEEINHATIIYFKGTCSSGKSTLIKSLSKDNLEIVDEDALVHEAYIAATKTRFPLEYAVIIRAIEKDNIYNSLRTKDRVFKNDATEKEISDAEKAILNILEELNQPQNMCWKQKISQSITKQCLDKITLALQENKNVLLDAWYIKPDDLKVLYPNTPIIKVMLYCSLPVAYERLLKRNNNAFIQGNLKEKRLYAQLIGSFCSLYEISQDPTKAIEKVELDELTEIFQLISENLEDEISPKKVFSFKEISREELQTLQNYFLKPFENGEPCYICPKESQDFIINNTSLETKKAVHLIEQMLLKI